MIKVSVMYPNTPRARFDHDYYRDKHMPLVKARTFPKTGPDNRRKSSVVVCGSSEIP